jgi:hypothetical protein
MAGLFKNFLVGASVAAGMSTLGMAPAFAGNLTNVSVSGQHLTYLYNGTQTYLAGNNQANLEAALGSDAGNIELAGQTTSADAAGFGTRQGLTYKNQTPTTLTGWLDNVKYTFSSLTYDDWFKSGAIGGYSTLAEKWFSEAWNETSTGLKGFVGTTTGVNTDALSASSAWFALKASGKHIDLFRRISDANISGVYSKNGDWYTELIGHLDHGTGLKFSEVVKVTVGEGTSAVTKYLYGLGPAIATGTTEASDNVSHNGKYVFKNGEHITASVPEPSTMLGLMAVGSLLMASKRKSEKNS